MATVTFYRIVFSDPPTEIDVETQMEKAYRLRGAIPAHWEERVRRLARGISVFDTIEAANREAVYRKGKLGKLIAKVILDDTSGVEFEATGDKGHWTIWGDRAAILKAMYVVSPVVGLK